MKKVVLITGASSGIGKKTAELLVQQGFIVYGAARRMEKMQDLKALDVHLIAMDVTDDISMTQGIQKIMDAEKRIDILVNNAGYGSFGSVEDVPLSEAKYQFEVNVFGLARLTQLVLPYMREQKSGKIINIASVAGKISEPLGAWYHASKFAVEGLSDCLRMELKQFGIEVVVIQPGPIKTEWDGIAEDNLAKVSGNTAYGRWQNHISKCLKASTSEDLSPLSLPISSLKPFKRKIRKQDIQQAPVQNSFCLHERFFQIRSLTK